MKHMTRAHKVYSAFLSQPVQREAHHAIVMENTLGGNVVWSRDSAGYYLGTLAGAFPENKTAVTPGNYSNPKAVLGYGQQDADNVFISLNNISDGQASDDALFVFVEVRVYT